MSSADHSVIYAEVVTPLSRSWSHPTVLEQIKSACVVLRKDVGPRRDVARSLHTLLTERTLGRQIVPELFECATYPLTCLIEHLWKKHEPSLKEGYVVDPFELETMAMLERALNYAHTGSACVLTRTLMDRAWLGLSVVNDGLPCISSSFIHGGSLSSGLITIRREKWPVHPVTQIPLTASQRSQELTYGKPHYSVSVVLFPYFLISLYHDIIIIIIIINIPLSLPIPGGIAHFWTPLKCAIRRCSDHVANGAVYR